jgi:type IX secretion system PorP/SprF family membrane protein
MRQIFKEYRLTFSCKTSSVLLTALLFLLLMGLRSPSASAQDPHYSQFYENPLYLNPALAGLGECTRFILNFRDQWPSIQDPHVDNSHAYLTYAASYDEYFHMINGGVGVQFWGDKAGGNILSTNAFNAMYAYRLDISEEVRLQAGLQASIFQKKVNWEDLVFGDQLHPINGIYKETTSAKNIPEHGRTTIFYPDFTAGVFAYQKEFRYYGGLAVKHMTQPNESLIGYESRLPMRFTVHGGALFHIYEYYEDEMFIAPDIMYTQQDKFKQLNVGLYWSNQTFFAGLWGRMAFGEYNISDAVIPRIGYKHDIFRISYSFDATLSDLGVARTYGAHELAIQIRFCDNKKEPIYCPRFY